MTRDSFLPRQGAAYVALVSVVGLFVIAISAMDVANRMLSVPFFTLAALTLLSGSATVRLPSVPATISISETFVFTSVLLFGQSAGAAIVALDGFIISIWLAKRRREFYRVAFNMAAPAISIWFSAGIYYTLIPGKGLYFEPRATNLPAADVFHLMPLLCFTLSHFIINSWLIAFAVSFETRRRAFDIWRTDFLWLSLNYFGGASLSALLLVYTRDIGWQYIGIIVPLLLVLYFTFKIPMDRVKDTNEHLKKVNTLYISTIETLALAIDAKDQVTHGHIRRVQTYTVGLAQALGVRDDLMLRAIEASALLHDMGKLAIPEHILNKPGKLTPAEFEKMKMHASIGADILTAIEFPYPVVPIVRHHHENWDGSGYPTGIAGTAIPIGARILSVVDCFDALTSDRPYRPALSTEAALAILAERRGTMYDPLVVDTFVRIHRQLIGHGESDIVPSAKEDHERKAEEPAGGLVSEMPTSGGLALFHLYQVLCDFGDRPWDDGADLVVYRLSQVLPVAA
jgi:putative nucleotidyltransferase with HDIG domain